MKNKITDNIQIAKIVAKLTVSSTLFRSLVFEHWDASKSKYKGGGAKPWLIIIALLFSLHNQHHSEKTESTHTQFVIIYFVRWISHNNRPIRFVYARPEGCNQHKLRCFCCVPLIDLFIPFSTFSFSLWQKKNKLKISCASVFDFNDKKKQTCFPSTK